MSDSRTNYPIFQAQLSHENDNLNQRLFWYLFSQSLLLGAYAGILNAPEKPHNPSFAAQQDLLVWVVPITALTISFALYPMIVISVQHMGNLRRQFEAQMSDDLSDLPPIHGSRTLRRVGDAAYLVMPVIITLAWVVLVGRLAL